MRWIADKKYSLLIVAAIVVAVGVSGRYVMGEDAPPAMAQRHIQQNIAALDSLKQRVDRLKYAAYMHIADAGFDKMDERQATVDKLVKDVDQSFSAYEKLVIDEKDKQFLDNDRRTFYPFITVLSEVIELSNENEQKDNALKLASTKLQAASDNVATALRSHLDYNLEKAWYETQNAGPNTNRNAVKRWWLF